MSRFLLCEIIIDITYAIWACYVLPRKKLSLCIVGGKVNHLGFDCHSVYLSSDSLADWLFAAQKRISMNPYVMNTSMQRISFCAVRV